MLVHVSLPFQKFARGGDVCGGYAVGAFPVIQERGEVEHRVEAVAPLGERLGGAGLAVDEDDDVAHLEAGRGQLLDGLELAAAGRRQVVDHDGALARLVGALDLRGGAVGFCLATRVDHGPAAGEADGRADGQRGVGEGG